MTNREPRGTAVAVRDAATISLRPVRPVDAPAIRTFLDAVSSDSLSLRFFGAPDLDGTAELMASDRYGDTFAVLALAGSPAQIVAHASYVRTGARHAEVAFLVADRWQGRGIGTILLERLVAHAGRDGVSRFVADVLPRNHRMLAMFRRTGLPLEIRCGEDAMVLDLCVDAAWARAAA
ncbi:MAG TPA: GNAT family N-acetyltransferase [Solirubrobacteraceae bacterium]